MRNALKRWAREFLYPDGPKVGEESKIDPQALADAGIRPGSGAKLGAEGMNYLLASLSDHAALTRFYALDTPWEAAADTGRMSAALRHPRSGLTYTVSEDANLTVHDHTGATEVDAAAAIWTSPENVRGCIAKDVDGAGRLVFFGPYASGLRARWSQAGDDFESFSTTSQAATSAVTPLGCAYDAENNATIVVGYRAGDTTVRPYIFAADGTFTAGTAWTETASSSPRRSMLAIGPGIAMLVYMSGGDAHAYTSEDGGVTWTHVADPPLASGEIFGLWYCSDFGTRGPRFVIVRSSGIIYSTDGASWTTEGLGSAEAVAIEASTTSIDMDGAVMIGSTVIWLKNARVFLHDVSRETAAVFSCALSSADDILFDGSRLWVVDSDAVGAVDAWRSQPFITPPTAIAGRFDD